MQVFDGHNDVLSRLWGTSADPVADFDRPIGHVNRPAARAGGLAGGFFALYSAAAKGAFDFSVFDNGMSELPLPPAMPAAAALEPVIAQAGIAQKLHVAGQIEICTTAAQLGRAFVSDPLACVLHLEGADCIGPELWELDALYAMGLRSLGPVWSRPTIFGEGVPFLHGGDGDTGAGLTALGRALVARCKDMGIMVDTSHLNVKGFWDVADGGIPLVATHSNACAVSMNARNLTDDQLRAIGQTGGMAGLNFATLFLSDTGWTRGHATLDDCLRQLDHMIDLAGEDHVGLGSDFDGAPMPQGLADAGDLPNLISAMRAHGYGEALIAKLSHENWLGFLSRHLN
ncbi:membrane dipeptidase [uncultured Sulfitobacter sp.]|uniref:dipeptidase n=1 Tax=uncultured Sulfitobacter sp. TaxID=191468 RepID=UPI00262F1925|nr:membrane dipeptidase [uncultured Sulfitobacter sp.]